MQVGAYLLKNIITERLTAPRPNYVQIQMKEFNTLINKTNDNRIKVYYNLSELERLTGLSIRALKYRMLDVKKKYNGVPSLLSKKNREWQIHYTIVDEFNPKYKTKNRNVETYDLQSMATWNPKFNYDVKYHLELIKEIKSQLPKNIISYAVELDKREINHTHIVSDADVYSLNAAINNTIRKYLLNDNEIQILVEPIRNKHETVEYIKKAPKISGTLR